MVVTRMAAAADSALCIGYSLRCAAAARGACLLRVWIMVKGAVFGGVRRMVKWPKMAGCGGSPRCAELGAHNSSLGFCAPVAILRQSLIVRNFGYERVRWGNFELMQVVGEA